MQNINPKRHDCVKISVPEVSCLITDPEPTLYTVHTIDETFLQLRNHSLNSTSTIDPISIHLEQPSTPLSLTSLSPNLLLALHDGTLITIDPFRQTSPSFIGNVAHPDPQRSGLLAATTSPDATLIALISPHSISLLDSDWNLLREIPLSRDLPPPVNASLSWRADGSVVAAMCIYSDSSLPPFITIIDTDTNSHEVSPAPHACNPPLSWIPRYGGMLAMAVPPSNESDPHSIRFFERNGLPHTRSDLTLPTAVVGVTCLAWSVDSSHLAVIANTNQQTTNTLYLYSRSNYNWTCKRTIIFRFIVRALHWDEDEPLLLRVVTSEGVISLPHQHTPATLLSLQSSTLAAVINGDHVALTNLSLAPVPPPLAHAHVGFPAPVQELNFLPGTNIVSVLLSDSSIHLLNFSDPPRRVQMANKEATVKTVGVYQLVDAIDHFGVMHCRWPMLLSDDLLLVISSISAGGESPSDSIKVYRLEKENNKATCVSSIAIVGLIQAITPSAKSASELVYVTNGGEVLQVKVDTVSGVASSDTVLSAAEPEHSPIDLRETRSMVDFNTRSGQTLTIFHSHGSELRIMDIRSNRQLLLSRDCTSFCVHEDGFLCFTTRSHLLYCFYLNSSEEASYQGKKQTAEEREFAPSVLDILLSDETREAIIEIEELDENRGALRPIDRGSQIVAAVPGDVSIILQAPRGNLETIALRPIVFEAVDRFSKAMQYSTAFALCRRQRVDMNHVVDADFDQFLNNIPLFISQVNKPSHLSIFLTFLKGDENRINTVCDTFVSKLKERDDFERFVSVILTALIRREPSDIAQALSFVDTERVRNRESAIAAIDYLFVLMKKEDTVYDEALGTYNLPLARFVAESSQLDPADYGEELKSLKALSENERKYNIDMKLERFDKALLHLHSQGENKYPACIAHCKEYSLYVGGLQLFTKDSPYRQELLEGYANYLEKENRTYEAAAIFVHLEQLQKASGCYRQCGHWQLAVNAAARCKSISDEEKEDLYEKIVEELMEKGNAVEAARIRVSLLGDLDGGLELLTNAEEWETAFESVVFDQYTAKSETMKASVDKMNSEICVEAVMEGYNALIGTLEENYSKLRERRNRLETLRETKRLMRERLGQKGERDEEASSDVFSATTASSLASNLSDVTFTSKKSVTSLYTTTTQVGPLSSAKLEKMAERRRRKSAKKRIREGHPQEEEYLMGYLKKLIPGDFLKRRVERLATALFFIKRAALVKNLYETMNIYIDEAKKLPTDVVTEEEKGTWSSNSWTTRLEIASIL